MSEKPIVFSGVMVRAVLAGTKTQTRRLVKPQPTRLMPVEGKPWPMVQVRWPADHTLLVGKQCSDEFGRLMEVVRCPYGQPGDRLWVRETWQVVKADANPPRVWYRADPGVEDCVAKSLVGWQGWRPAIYMPRAACRLVLEVSDVRVERLQEISEADAEAEGCFALGDASCTARYQFECLWDSLNAKRAPWASNPFVWVISFRRTP